MTREQAKNLLPVLTAFAEGKAIQYKVSQEVEWQNTSSENPSLGFDPDCCQYRIKPEPREFFITLPEWTVHKSRPTDRAIIHVREVL